MDRTEQDSRAWRGWLVCFWIGIVVALVLVLLARFQFPPGSDAEGLSNGTISFLHVSAAACAVLGLAALLAFLVTDPRSLKERSRAFIGPRAARDHLGYRISLVRVAASQKDLALGAEPSELQPRAVWEEERRNAVRSLAELARNDSELLREAATGEQVAPGARDLLIDAAEHRG